ncbi:phage/plasmid primase, P4 family [Butyrivibrio sp. MB2005]|uniref:phage/plasmid primase, P4 family n=1 Tax=Butyrivibrio sp. MB2005 TaxID=1280678 RepID=UPI00042368AB|nr:phage/plasmid primase, P4 family [Butyrivibrio sp. MB2005]
MQFRLYTADVTGNRGNCLYPHEVVITNEKELAKAVEKDHVAAKYKDSYRNNSKFLSSDVISLDIDNTETDEAEGWITPDKLGTIMPNVQYCLVPSRNNMKEKDGRTARPKFHVFFPIDECDNADIYAAIKGKIQQKYPFFDPNALDAARFLFGSCVRAEDIIFHDGWESIEEACDIDRASLKNFAKEDKPVKGPAAFSKIIPLGKRNNTLSIFAARVLKRYGESDKTHQLFISRAADCEEPLEDAELNTIWNSAVGFYYKKVIADPTYKAPAEYSKDFGNFSLLPDDFSDVGEATVFAREYADQLKYTDGTHFLNYTGEFWEESALSAMVPYMEFIDLQLADARETLTVARDNLIATGVSEEMVQKGGKTLEKCISDMDELKAYQEFVRASQYFAFVMKRRDYRYIQSTINTVRPMVRIGTDELDSDGFLLNTPGMTIDLRKDITEAHYPDPMDLITKQTSVAPGDEGEFFWQEALDTFFCGDEELIEYVQKIVGLAAIGEVFMEALIIAYGDGRNGKSTFWNTIANVLGSYAGTISAETLTVGCKHNARPEMAELKGKRLVIAAELEDGMRLSTSVVKKLCSTDEIAAEKKYKDPFKFRPSHTLILYTNHLPKVGVSDTGTWRRLIVIPFNAKIEGNSDIKNYTNYLTEHAGPAIMKWIIEGAHKAMKDEFRIVKPKVVVDAIEKYRADNDWLGEFLSEKCDLDPAYKVKSGDFYQEYRNFCQMRGNYTRSTTDFYAALEAVGLNRKRSKAGVLIYGVQLKNEDFLE